MVSILTSFDELNFSLIVGHWVIRRGCAPGPPGQIQKRPQGDFECLHHTYFRSSAKTKVRQLWRWSTKSSCLFVSCKFIKLNISYVSFWKQFYYCLFFSIFQLRSIQNSIFGVFQDSKHFHVKDRYFFSSKFEVCFSGLL